MTETLAGDDFPMGCGVCHARILLFSGAWAGPRKDTGEEASGI
jgi:hypothetical protein